ncbi:hypothetical protein QQ045_020514 [Rhodiola kirilowii]
MQIFVYSPTGIMCLQVESSHTILDVKAKIQIKKGFPPDMQLLSYGAKELRDGRTLAEYGIEDESDLRVDYRLGEAP